MTSSDKFWHPVAGCRKNRPTPSMAKITPLSFWQLLKQAGTGFSRDKVPKLSASLSYYTLFSLGPVLLVVIFFAELFYGEDATKGALFGQLEKLVGASAAQQIEVILQNAA